MYTVKFLKVRVGREWPWLVLVMHLPMPLKEVPQNGSTLLPLGRIRTQRIQNPHFRGREQMKKNCHPPVPLLATDQNKPFEGKAVFLLWQPLFPPKGNTPDPSLEAERKVYSVFSTVFLLLLLLVVAVGCPAAGFG